MQNELDRGYLGCNLKIKDGYNYYETEVRENEEIIITKTNKLFMYRIIIGDDRGEIGYRGLVHFAKLEYIMLI